MFVTIRKYKGCSDTKSASNLADQILLPLLREVPGFISYIVVSSDKDSIFSISVFDSRESAKKANQIAQDVVEKYFRELLPNSPEIILEDIIDTESLPPGTER